MEAAVRSASVTITLREAGPDDLDAILEMIRRLAEFERMADQVAFDPEDMRVHLFGPDPVASVLLAEVDGAVAGMALWFGTFSSFVGRPGIWLEDLYVHSDYRGSGVGEALVRRLLTMTDGDVEWNVLDWNSQSDRVLRATRRHPRPHRVDHVQGQA